ncbi:MAG: RNA methyltransferase [Clostridia bacterium]|nr:RNA methyltransferase [Clostridia bacterium]
MAIEKITSARNQLVARLKTLKDKRGRDKEGLMLIEGGKMLAEAVDCGLKPVYVLAKAEKIEGLSPLFAGTQASIYEVSENALAAVCDTVTPQGCAAAFVIPDDMDDDIASWPGRIVALDGVQDPGNVGTIWRTADAAGFEAIIAGADCADLYSPKVQRAAMGSGFRLGRKSEPNLAKRLEELKNAGYDIIVSALDGEEFYSRGLIADRFVLVVGSEARGVTVEVGLQATRRLKLPMRGGAESLNAAVAAGIMMYELTRGL